MKQKAVFQSFVVLDKVYTQLSQVVPLYKSHCELYIYFFPTRYKRVNTNYFFLSSLLLLSASAPIYMLVNNHLSCNSPNTEDHFVDKVPAALVSSHEDKSCE